MTLQIDLPPEIESRLRAASPDLEGQVREALLIDFYRHDQLTQHELGIALNLGRFEVEALLKKYQVTEDLATSEEYDAALRHLRVLTGN